MELLAPTHMQAGARKRQIVRQGWMLAAIDLLVICACFAAGCVIAGVTGGFNLEEAVAGRRTHNGNVRLLMQLGLGAVCLLAFWQLGHYARRRPIWQEMGDILAVIATMAVVDAALVFLADMDSSRLWWAASWSLAIVAAPLLRIGVKRLLRAGGFWLRPTVIIGTGPNAMDAASALASEPLLGFEVIAFVAPPGTDIEAPGYIEAERARYPVLRIAPESDLLPAHLGRPHLVIALEMDEMAHCGTLIERLSRRYGDVDVVSPLRGLPLAGTRVTRFFSHDVLTLRLSNSLARPWPRRFKRAFDLVAGALLLVLVSPLFALISLHLAATGRPIVYRHERVGKGGKPFMCLKFRTMVPDAERVLADYLARHPEAHAEWQRDRKLRDDPRITPFGAWLRRTSLDELPQLINVLRGDMSLVGPRPVVAAELALYGPKAIYYVESTPGLTGLWQVSGRNDLDYRRRIHLDCWYVKNWSLWCDLVILMRTPRAVVRGHGAY